MIYLCKKYLQPQVQGKTVKMGFVTEEPSSARVELEVAGTVLLNQFVEDVYLKDFMNCKYKLRLDFLCAFYVKPLQLKYDYVFSQKFTPVFDMNDDRKLDQISFAEICQRKVRKTILFKTEADKQTANTICLTLGGVLVSEITSTECNTFWADLHFNATQGAWLSESPETSGLEWMRNFPQAERERRCTVVRSREKRMINVGCHFKTCFSCSVDAGSLFTLEGRHHESLLDQNYTLEHNGSSSSLYWRGLQSSLIVRKEKAWEIRDSMSGQMIAVSESRSLESPFPLGTVQWRTGSERTELSVLRLSSCSPGQFGCHDGLCVDIKYRCDMIHHCQDKSDEVDCHTLRNVSLPEPNKINFIK